jgi:hypothetical protein
VEPRPRVSKCSARHVPAGVGCNSLSATRLLVRAYEARAAVRGGTINCVIAGRMLSYGNRGSGFYKSRTAVQPVTLVAVITARTTASATTSAAIAPNAVSDTLAGSDPVETASI